MLLAEREIEVPISVPGNFLALLAPKGGVGKSTIAINILKEFPDAICVDLDPSGRNPKKYFERVFTIKEVILRGQNPWKVTTRLNFIKDVDPFIRRKKVLFNLPTGIPEDVIFVFKRYRPKIIVVSQPEYKKIVEVMKRIIEKNELTVNGIILNNCEKEYEDDLILGRIPPGRIKTFFEEDPVTYGPWKEIVERIREIWG